MHRVALSDYHQFQSRHIQSVMYNIEVYRISCSVSYLWLRCINFKRKVIICIMHTDLSNRKAHHKRWWCSHRNSHCISPYTCRHYGNTSQNWCSDLNNQALHQELLLPSLLSQASPHSSSESGCIREILSDLLRHLDGKLKQKTSQYSA